jgi:ABC-type uncharacterized transport system substrate-binding protein
MMRFLRGWGKAAAIVLGLAPPSLAAAHPHVWVTMRSEIGFAPDGNVTSVIHDWTFDEMYSAFATQGLAQKGQLAKREDFAPLAKENAGQLAQIGYFTVVKIGGKQVDFGIVTDYWMEERPDHLVTLHVVLPLKTPEPPGKFVTMMVSDPEFFIDFEFDDKDRSNSTIRRPAARCRSPTPRLSTSPTPRSSANPSLPICRRARASASNWRAARSSPAHDRVFEPARSFAARPRRGPSRAHR